MKNVIMAAAMTFCASAGVLDDYLLDDPEPTPAPAATAVAADPGERGNYGYSDLTRTSDSMAAAADGIYHDASAQHSSITLASAPTLPFEPTGGTPGIGGFGGGEDDEPAEGGSWGDGFGGIGAEGFDSHDH